MSKCVFCFIYYNSIIILLSVTVFVCHDKGNVFFCTINSPVYVYWKQEEKIHQYMYTGNKKIEFLCHVCGKNEWFCVMYEVSMNGFVSCMR